MRILVWQWGRRGAGPRFATALAEGLRADGDHTVMLSLSTGAEILRSAAAPHCDLPVETYRTAAGLARRFAQTPVLLPRLTQQLRRLQPDLAICAMPGPLDMLMVTALRLCGIPSVAVVHDADAHPGDGMPLLMTLQQQLTRSVDGVVALSSHVASRLIEQSLVDHRRLFVLQHPPFCFGPPPASAHAHGGATRLLCFGRLLPYKGLDLLQTAITRLPSQPDWQLRIVGDGPDSSVLRRLSATPRVSVEKRWVAEDEINALIGWADLFVLPYKEASQSGIAPAALAAGRRVVSTRVGGLAEQLGQHASAMLCEPNADSLTATLVDAILRPPPASPEPIDSHAAWRDMAHELLWQVEHAGIMHPSTSQGWRSFDRFRRTPARLAPAPYRTPG